MGHHHTPAVDFEKRYVFDDQAKKFLLGFIIAGIVCIILGLFIAMSDTGQQAGEAHGGDQHSSVEATTVFQNVVNGQIAEGGTGHGSDHNAGGHGTGVAEEHGSHGHDKGPLWIVRLVANILISNYFFLCISILSLFFLAVKNVSNGGWHVGFMRIPEAMATFMFVPPIILLLLFVGAKDILYEWTIPDIVNNDPLGLLPRKTWWLNTGFFLGRNILYFGIWIFFLFQIRKLSEFDNLGAGRMPHFIKRLAVSAIFIILFALTFSAASWDWVMSIETHWFSTMFSVYCFASSWVTAISIITILTIYLHSKGYLQHLNISHFHDLGRLMFGFTVFWAYIWFSQFLLIWYANIPEETIYFYKRINDYPFMFFGMIFINFLIPFLFLLRKGNLRHIPSLMFMAIFLVIGHWLDFVLMIMPGTMGANGGVGFLEIGFFLLYIGLFGFVVLTNLSKRPLVPKNHPYLLESLNHET